MSRRWWFQLPESFGLALFALVFMTLVVGAGSAAPSPPLLTHGPMLGEVSTHTARVWVRANRSADFSVKYSRVGGGRASESAVVRLGPDFTGVAELTNLEPNTDYQYVIVLDGAELPAIHKQQFRTAPPDGARSVLRVAFGAGLGAAQQPVWDVLQRFDPNLFILAGDSVELTYRRDKGEIPTAEEVRYHYRAARGDEKLRRFSARTPTVALWSDLDYGAVGANGKLPYKKLTLELFREYWANATYGDYGQPGIGHKVTFGSADIFLLDARYNQVPGKTMLGQEQLDWLLRELSQSRATFKILVSDPPWNLNAAADDNWTAYPLEYARLMEFLTSNRIKGVVFLSGNTRRQEVHTLPVPSSYYRLYELVSGRLGTNPAADTCGPAAPGRTACFDTIGFGGLILNTEVSPPTLTLQLVNLAGQLLTQEVLTTVQLGYQEGEAEAILSGHPWRGTGLIESGPAVMEPR